MDYLQEAKEVEAIESTGNHRFLWFIFFGVIFFVIILVILLIVVGGNKNISDNKLIEGVAFEVGDNDAVNFDLDEEKHGMRISFIGDDTVELTISSDPINLTLKINELKEVDLNNDKVPDIRIKLVSIVNGKATIALQRIGGESCKENWECSGWSACFNGIQKRNCEDLNSCGTTFYKPSGEKDCLEIEFVENNSAFQNGTNNSLNNSLNNTIHQNATNLTNQTLNNTIKVNTTVILNCGNVSNYSCFVNASKKCFPAKGTLRQELNLLGVIASSTTYFEIRGYSSDDKCVLYQKSLSSDLVYSTALKQSLSNTYTTAQINSMEMQARESVQSTVGTEKICKFNQANLTKLLTNWDEGNYSSSDYESVECYPHGNFDCKLDFNGIQVAGMILGPINTSSGSGTGTISVRGYSDSSKVYWSVSNSSVIGLSPTVGNFSRIYPLKVGKTIITIKDTSLSSCELKFPFEVFKENQEEVSVCDNDSNCEWDNDETISNCPHDCIGDSTFFSNYSCESNDACSNYEEYPICVLNLCAKPTQALKNFIAQHYPTGNCETISCNNCSLGRLHLTGVGYYGFELNFCTECSKYGSVFPCKEGSVCYRGLCISQTNSTNTTGSSN